HKEAVVAAVALLEGVQRPVIIAGGGSADSCAEVRALAARIGAPIATTVRAKGWFDDDPFCLDIAGGFSSEIAEEVLRQADLVAASGGALSAPTRADGFLFPQAQILQIDAAPYTECSMRAPVAAYVQGEAPLSLKAILAGLGGRNREGLRTQE